MGEEEGGVDRYVQSVLLHWSGETGQTVSVPVTVRVLLSENRPVVIIVIQWQGLSTDLLLFSISL